MKLIKVLFLRIALICLATPLILEAATPQTITLVQDASFEPGLFLAVSPNQEFFAYGKDGNLRIDRIDGYGRIADVPNFYAEKDSVGMFEASVTNYGAGAFTKDGKKVYVLMTSTGSSGSRKISLSVYDLGSGELRSAPIASSNRDLDAYQIPSHLQYLDESRLHLHTVTTNTREVWVYEINISSLSATLLRVIKDDAGYNDEGFERMRRDIGHDFGVSYQDNVFLTPQNSKGLWVATPAQDYMRYLSNSEHFQLLSKTGRIFLISRGSFKLFKFGERPLPPLTFTASYSGPNQDAYTKELLATMRKSKTPLPGTMYFLKINPLNGARMGPDMTKALGEVVATADAEGNVEFRLVKEYTDASVASGPRVFTIQTSPGVYTNFTFYNVK